MYIVDLLNVRNSIAGFGIEDVKTSLTTSVPSSIIIDLPMDMKPDKSLLMDVFITGMRAVGANITILHH